MSRGGWGGLKEPVISLSVSRIAFNDAAAKECIGDNLRVMLFADCNEFVIGFCFIKGECPGSGKIGGRAEGRTGAVISAKQFFATYPALLTKAAQLEKNRYSLKRLPEADVPEEFAGSKCFFVKLEK